FQAEDGIRDGHVTGVQTCALPIYKTHSPEMQRRRRFAALLFPADTARWPPAAPLRSPFFARAEKPGARQSFLATCRGRKDRHWQIGRASCRKECRAGWAANQCK